MPRDWWISTEGALVRSQEEDILGGRVPIREVCMTLTGHQESEKASWKRGQLWRAKY